MLTLVLWVLGRGRVGGSNYGIFSPFEYMQKVTVMARASDFW